MSEIRKQKMKCPSCGEEIELEMWESINMPYDETEKENILNNTFFHMECPKCKARSNVAYRCEYNDIDKRYLILLMPGSEEDIAKEILEYNKRLKEDRALQFARAGYTLRIVRDNNELREKVLTFDEGFDDRYIELMKLVYYMELRKSLPKESTVLGIFFDKHDEGEYHWVVIFNDRKPATVRINMDMYEDMKQRLKDSVEEATPEGICRIYVGWASNVMNNKNNIEN